MRQTQRKLESHAAEGIAEGEYKKALATARNLLAMKILYDEQIAQATNLSVSEVAAL